MKRKRKFGVDEVPGIQISSDKNNNDDVFTRENQKSQKLAKTLRSGCLRPSSCKKKQPPHESGFKLLELESLRVLCHFSLDYICWKISTAFMEMIIL